MIARTLVRVRLLSRELVSPQLARFLVAAGAYQASNLLVNLAAARWLNPVGFGQLNAVSLTVGYMAYIQFGTLNGMNREVPSLRGMGNAAAADAVQRVAFTAGLVTTVIGAMALLIAGLVQAPGQAWRVTLVLSAILFVFIQAGSFFRVHAGTLKRFDLLAQQQGVSSVAMLVIVLPMIWAWGLTGTVVGTSLVLALGAGVIWTNSRFVPHLGMEWRQLKSLLRIGLPLMASGFLFGVLTTLDRWIVLQWWGESELGIYSFLGKLLILPITISLLVAEQMYPYMAERFGATGNPADLRPLLRRLVLTNLAVSVLSAIGLLVLYPLLVSEFLPAYLSSMPLLIPTLAGTTVLSQCIGLGAFLAASDRQVGYMIVLAVWVAIGFIVLASVATAGGKLVGVATGAAGVYAGFYLSLVVLAARTKALATHRDSGAIGLSPVVGP